MSGKKATITAMDNEFMVTSLGRLSEPFDFGREEKRAPKDPGSSDHPKGERSKSEHDTSLLQLFASETSAHGCSHINSERRGIFSRVLWAVGVLLTLSMMVFTLHTMLAAYDEYPFNTVTKMAVKRSMQFPAITVCNLNDVDTSLISLDEETFRSTKSTLLLSDADLNESDPKVAEVLNTPIDTLVNSSWIQDNDFLLACLLNSIPVPCNVMFTTVQGSSARCTTVNTSMPDLQYMSNAGPISGVRIYLNIHQDGYVFSNYVAAGVKLFMHQPGHTPDFQSSGLLLAPGFSHYVSTKPVKYKFLADPFKAYGDEACVQINDPSAVPVLRLTQNYSYSACTLECAVDETAKFCGCRGVLNDDNSLLPLCNMRQFYTCYEHHLTAVYFNVSEGNKCHCPRPCEFMEYESEISSAKFPSAKATEILQQMNILPVNGVRSDGSSVVSDNFMELRIFFEKMTLLEIVHEPVFTYVYVMGTIGGQMGFFLGASVLTAAEVAELCMCFLIRILRRISGPKTRVIHAQDEQVHIKPSAVSS